MTKKFFYLNQISLAISSKPSCFPGVFDWHDS